MFLHELYHLHIKAVLSFILFILVVNTDWPTVETSLLNFSLYPG